MSAVARVQGGCDEDGDRDVAGGRYSAAHLTKVTPYHSQVPQLGGETCLEMRQMFPKEIGRF